MVIRSFKDVIADKYYDLLFDLLAAHVNAEPEALASRSYTVKNPDQAELSEFDIKHVNITKTGEDSIQFDVIVSAEIEISERRRHSDIESDSCEQWYHFTCGARLDDGIYDFVVSDVGIYNGKRKNEHDQLSEHLVPFIRADQLEDEAGKFLRKYYPEALLSPMPVSPHVLAERMGLDIQMANLTKNLAIFGQIYFADCDVKVYDGESHSYKPLAVKRGTILVDPTVYFLRTVGSVNNTIVHECVHWDKHRLFFELEHLYNRDAHSISCRVSEGERPDNKRSPLEWMEWQANALAPRILMPAEPTRTKIDELLAKAKRDLQTDDSSQIMEAVVFELSNFYVVSKVSAKIRMIDLGYIEAAGVCNYMNGHYISNHSFEKASLQKGQTFTISVQDALVEYAVNPKLREILDSGDYIYVDGHYCINNSHYIESDGNGSVCLTDFAKQHIDECCLLFDLHVRTVQKDTTYYTECVLYRNAASDTIVEAGYSDSAQNKAIQEKAAQLKKDTMNLAKIQNELPSSFPDTLKAHMKRTGCTVESLAEKSQVSAKTIQRMRNDRDHSVSLQTVIAVCIGLQLHPVLSMEMVEKAGFRFKPANEEHITYQLLLDSYYLNTIYECNEILLSNGFRLLGREE